MSKAKRSAKIVLLSLATLVFALALAVNYISTGALEFGRDIGLFPRYNTSETWSQRGTFKNITITPSGWTFSVWGLIYLYQAVLLGFLWSTVCRRVLPDGAYLCCDPDLAPFGVLVFHALSSLFNGTWILLADRTDFDLKLLIPLSLTLFCITFSLYGALVSSYCGLARAKNSLLQSGRTLDYWLTVGLVQNGLSLYAGWCTIASFLNLDILLVFYADLDEAACSVGCLSAILAIVLIYAAGDLTLLDGFTRFVFTPHIIVMWAGAGSLSRNYEPGAPTSAITIALISLAGAALAVKIGLIFVRTRSRPILQDANRARLLQSENPQDAYYSRA